MCNHICKNLTWQRISVLKHWIQWVNNYINFVTVSIPCSKWRNLRLKRLHLGTNLFTYSKGVWKSLSLSQWNGELWLLVHVISKWSHAVDFFFLDFIVNCLWWRKAVQGIIYHAVQEFVELLQSSIYAYNRQNGYVRQSKMKQFY